MTHECLNEQELAELGGLAADHPRRAEAEACPRCRSLLLDYQEFVSPPPAPPQARVADARIRLAQSLRDAAQTAATADSPGLAPSRTVTRAGRFEWARQRPALAIAAALLVVSATYFGGRLWPGHAPAPDVLRTAPMTDPSRGTGATIPLEVRRGAEGSAVLTWRATEGADAYQVRLIAPDLSETAPWAPAPDTVFIVTASRLPAGMDRGQGFACRVVALQNGDVIAASPAVAISLGTPAPGR